MPADIGERCDAIEDCYEYMLGYAGQGVPANSDNPASGEIRGFLQRAAQALVKRAALLVMAAAPADYRPASPAAAKLPRAGAPFTVELEGTPDILTSLKRPKGCVVVGFALETGGDGVARAREKLREKALDYIILNDALEPGAGFEVATNRVTIIGKTGEPVELPLLPKRDVAEKILDAVERALT